MVRPAHEGARGRGGDDAVSVATVAGMLGVAPSTLRTWARRYGLEPSAHRFGLHRRYSAEDISRLQLMRALTESGMSSRDAAERARAADATVLSRASQAELAADADPGRLSAVTLAAPPSRPSWAEPVGLDGVAPAVRTLLATAARGDAIGTTALMRGAVRDLGAARTFDERVRPARRAARTAPGPLRERILSTLDAAVREAAGEVVPRRAPRNGVPVLLAATPGAADAAALVLCRAAFADRSIAAVIDAAPRSVEDTLGRAATCGASVALLADHHGAAHAAVVLRADGGPHLLWGPGWVAAPRRAAGLADVVRLVEASCTNDG